MREQAFDLHCDWEVYVCTIVCLLDGQAKLSYNSLAGRIVVDLNIILSKLFSVPRSSKLFPGYIFEVIGLVVPLISNAVGAFPV